MADIQQRHQLVMKQLSEQHISNQSELDATQLKSQLATQQVSLLYVQSSNRANTNTVLLCLHG